MARLFDDASSQYLETDSTVLAAHPFTLACWAKSDDLAVDQVLIFLGDKDVTSHYARIRLDNATPKRLQATVKNTTTLNAEI